MFTSRQDEQTIGGLVILWAMTVVAALVTGMILADGEWERAAVREGYGHFSKPNSAFKWGPAGDE